MLQMQLHHQLPLSLSMVMELQRQCVHEMQRLAQLVPQHIDTQRHITSPRALPHDYTKFFLTMYIIKIVYSILQADNFIHHTCVLLPSHHHACLYLPSRTAVPALAVVSNLP